eukprot:CAMPEP_0206554440 /NCGR_PEP_ID=MMETSP0325_2-20121206/17191_1 /ASSEMBLY_ACC=CAM_ASM_000347 /TAXON_ID=2866 /ORGANISM="Crypthecodinium cohnii, Strain Seligo" /LENGTH=350 /DNA_ID=CAMNT_0054054533 /DNA_START=286 /DNA_END=1338 /DNA_ORIENTATION=-
MMPLGGTDAKFKVDDDLISTIEDAGVQAVKVTIDVTGEKLSLGASFPSAPLDEVFKGIQGSVEEKVPCLIVAKLLDADKSVDAGPKDLALFGYMPEGSPPKLRMLQASSRKTMKEALSGWSIREVVAGEASELSRTHFVESTRSMTAEERRDAMSREELEREEVQKQVSKEQSAAPRMMAGMASLKIEADPSFIDGCAAAKEGEKACVAKIEGDKTTTLTGSVLEGISKPSDLKGKLPDDQPCYVLLKNSEAEGRLVLVSWLPDNVAARARMKFSSFKASVVSMVKSETGADKLATSEVTDQDDLTDDIGVQVEHGENESPSTEDKPKTGFKPPVGGFALPGMGMGLPRH